MQSKSRIDTAKLVIWLGKRCAKDNHDTVTHILIDVP